MEEVVPVYSVSWWLIFVLAIIPHVPLLFGLFYQRDDSHTFFTWILYLILDCITMFSGIKERINMDPMVFGFAVGSLIMASILLYQKRFVSWTKVEMTAITLITICVVVWLSFGSFLALMASILSEAIVGTYLIIQTYKHPKVKFNLTGYTGFFIVSITSILSTKNWNPEEVGFAVSESILNFIILIPLIKKWWKLKILA